MTAWIDKDQSIDIDRCYGHFASFKQTVPSSWSMRSNPEVPMWLSEIARKDHSNTMDDGRLCNKPFAPNPQMIYKKRSISDPSFSKREEIPNFLRFQWRSCLCKPVSHAAYEPRRAAFMWWNLNAIAMALQRTIIDEYLVSHLHENWQSEWPLHSKRTNRWKNI